MTTRQFLIRTGSFIVLTLVWYFDVLWLAILGTLWYSYYYRAYELIVLGVLIDVQYRSGVSIPYYTLGFTLLCVAAEWLKPKLRRTTIDSL